MQICRGQGPSGVVHEESKPHGKSMNFRGLLIVELDTLCPCKASWGPRLLVLFTALSTYLGRAHSSCLINKATATSPSSQLALPAGNFCRKAYSIRLLILVGNKKPQSALSLQRWLFPWVKKNHFFFFYTVWGTLGLTEIGLELVPCKDGSFYLFQAEFPECWHQQTSQWLLSHSDSLSGS